MRRSTKSPFHLLLIPLLLSHSVIAETPTKNKSAPLILDYESRFHPVIGNNGIVSSQESRASEIGLQVLKDGGNAIDAAIAVAYALSVTLPKAGNLGGGGFMLVHSAKDNETYAFDFREMAPAAASRDMYIDMEGNVNTKRARFSPKAVGVPGTVRGLSAAHEKFATKPLKALIQPAIILARDGIPVSPGLATDLVIYEEKLKSSPTITKVFCTPSNPGPQAALIFPCKSNFLSVKNRAASLGEHRLGNEKIPGLSYGEAGRAALLEDVVSRRHPCRSADHLLRHLGGRRHVDQAEAGHLPSQWRRQQHRPHWR